MDEVARRKKRRAEAHSRLRRALYLLRFLMKRPRVFELQEGEFFVTVKHDHYLVWDNGGEVGIEKLNIRQMWFVPSEQNRCKVDPLNLADMISSVFRGVPINYEGSFKRGDIEHFLEVLEVKEGDECGNMNKD